MESRLKSTKLHTLRRHLERLERRLQRLEALSQRHTRIRVWIVLLGIATAMLVSRMLGDSAGGITAIIAVSLFVIVALSHGRVKTSISRHKLWHHIKATHVARMALDWTQIPLPQMTPLAAGHPFETDLNLTGTHPLSIVYDEVADPGLNPKTNALGTGTIQDVLEPTAAGFKVQCSSCHDVHDGIGEAVPDTHLLRVSTKTPPSGLCLTCHKK